MKNYILIIMVALSSSSLHSQQNVFLSINHNLIDQTFLFNQESTNNLANNFVVTRLEYYLSNIVITHDGGQITPATDVYALVNAEYYTLVELGNYNVINVESITFGVGVNPEVNNDDPSLWPASHPLAPKSPSMHWGWSAGYRFVAMEGDGGDGLPAHYEIHALGNENYFTTTINTLGDYIDNNVYINLKADYAEALRNIDVSQNLISHGSTGESITLLENFRDHVFSSFNETDIMESTIITDLKIWPNPAVEEINVSIPTNHTFNKILVTDVLGRTVLEKNMQQQLSNYTFNLKENGMFFIKLYSDNNLVSSKKVIVEN
jgi:Secretion system C-terminal sorting domain